MFSRKTVPLHPDDERILSIIRELSAQVSYYKINIQTITWLDRMGIRRFPPDALLINPRFHTLQLSTQAMGRLTPEEWRPILASGLLYYKNLTRGMLKVILPSLVAALLSPFIILADINLLGDPRNPILYEIQLIPLFAILALGFFLLIRFQKRFYLENDDKAAELVGKDALITSLKKLGAINNEASSKRGFVRPSIQERIRHLQTVL